MRLTPALWLFKRPKGALFSGKYRFVKRVTQRAVDTLRYELEQEERNMFYLRHPYLTKEETICMKQLEGPVNWCEINRSERNAKFERKRTIAEELDYLNITQDWDFKGGYKF